MSCVCFQSLTISWKNMRTREDRDRLIGNLNEREGALFQKSTFLVNFYAWHLVGGGGGVCVSRTFSYVKMKNVVS